MKNVDYYKVLEVRFGDDKAAITSSYRRLCKLYHPDINHDPGAEDLMKEINNAYYILCDETRREEYNMAYFSKSGKQRSPSAARTRERVAERDRARHVMKDYFDALRLNAFEMAYELLSEYDKQYITQHSFYKWRETVQKLFLIRKYEIKTQPAATLLTLDNGKRAPAWKHEIVICERNLVTREVVNYSAEKFTIIEPGGWRIFLGYKDINEIARMFEKLSRDQERGEMLKFWEEYCSNRCRELDMLNLKGFLKEASKEVYRMRRYGQELTAACYKLSMPGKERLPVDALERAAGVFKTGLREIDIPAYLGEGFFIVLFVCLGEEFAADITGRISANLTEKLPLEGEPRVNVRHCYCIYEKGELGDCVEALRRHLIK